MNIQGPGGSRNTAPLKGTGQLAQDSGGLSAPDDKFQLLKKDSLVRTGPLAQDVRSGINEPTPAEIAADIDRMLGGAPETGSRFITAPPAAWTTQEAIAVRDALRMVPASDRAALRNTVFENFPAGTTNLSEPFGDASFYSNNVNGVTRIRISDAVSSLPGRDTPDDLRSVVLHEIGHVVQGQGRWDASEIREFGKLSQWTRPDGSIANGYDRNMNAIPSQGNDKPGRTDNFVSEYAKSAPHEDFAESYRTYLSNPAQLLAAAPEKFLYINATRKAYSVEDMLRMQGPDPEMARERLEATVDQLASSRLNPETLDRIRAQFPAGSLPNTAGLAGVIKSLRGMAGNVEALEAFKSNPDVLGNALKGLSAGEMKILADPALRAQLVADVRGVAIAPKDAIRSNDVKALQDMFRAIVNDSPKSLLRAGWLKQSPKARYDYIKAKLQKALPKMSPEMQAIIKADLAKGTKSVVYALGNHPTFVRMMEDMWPKRAFFGLIKYDSGDPKMVARANSAIDKLGEAEFQAWSDLLARGDQKEINGHMKNIDLILRKDNYGVMKAGLEAQIAG
ncbi:MAG: putative zinc-binding metallopeptidase [Candidatus Sericytochromatia bacterium]|nr:putative zinc-binding metallopeptidase [Candidatus Sericytochromatia bacterium]